MIDVDQDHRRRTPVVVSKFRRRLSPLEAGTQGSVRRAEDHGLPDLGPKADAVVSEVNAIKTLEPQQGVASNRDAERPAGEFSPGKNDLDPDDGNAPAVSSYANRIGASWRQAVQDVMEVARLCAEASARLTAAQKSELMAHLPFRWATFSKLAQIGADTRLNAPEIQRLLPPHYTTMYAVTLLKDEELKQAIAERVLHPDMKREELQKWHRAPPRKVGRVPSSKGVASDSDDGGNRPAPASPKDASHGKRSTAAAGGQTDPEVRSSDAMHDAAIEEVVSPSTAPTSEDIPAFLDRRPLSAEDQRVFDVIMAAWNSASPVVRERVRAEMNRANTPSRSAEGMPARTTPRPEGDGVVHPAAAAQASPRSVDRHA